MCYSCTNGDHMLVQAVKKQNTLPIMNPLFNSVPWEGSGGTWQAKQNIDLAQHMHFNLCDRYPQGIWGCTSACARRLSGGLVMGDIPYPLINAPSDNTSGLVTCRRSMEIGDRNYLKAREQHNTVACKDEIRFSGVGSERSEHVDRFTPSLVT
ncbi:hypothetical protein BC826DRAFT_513000 [Russula brevipes]|nr:hypothetical protein BC826DRAFT_513000 [Russula brevipes]